MGQPETQDQPQTEDQTPPAGLIEAFGEAFGGEPAVLARGPGRADLIGTHVDYNDGPVLTAAISRSAWVAARLSGDRRMTIRSLDMDQQVTFDLDALERKADIEGRSLPDWALYPAGVAYAMTE